MRTGIQEKIREVLSESRDIGIVSHIHADGDAIGSQLALKNSLEALGKQVQCYNTARLQDVYAFLKGYEEIGSLPGKNDPWPEVLVAVDCGNLNRIGLQGWPEDTRMINIDHHAGNTEYGALNWVDEKSPATCEMIADFLRDWPLKIDGDTATALYTGLSTDTGSFKFDRTTSHTLETAAFLLDQGADKDLIRYHVYESMSQAHFNAQKLVLGDTTFHADGKLAASAIDFETQDALHIGEVSYSGIITHMKDVEGVEVAVFFRELEGGTIKVSLRSKNYFDVNAFAQRYDGGGHVRAAGLKVRDALPTTRARIVAELSEALLNPKELPRA